MVSPSLSSSLTVFGLVAGRGVAGGRLRWLGGDEGLHGGALFGFGVSLPQGGEPGGGEGGALDGRGLEAGAG